MAERARFELAEACASAVFKTAALNHSTISPSVSPLIYLLPEKMQVNLSSFLMKKGLRRALSMFFNSQKINLRHLFGLL